MCTSWRDEEVEVQLHSFLTSALDGYGCHTNALSLNRSCSGQVSTFRRREKSLAAIRNCRSDRLITFSVYLLVLTKTK